MDNYFYHTGISPTNQQDLLELCESEWQHDPVSFIHARIVPINYLDDFCRDLMERYKGVALILKLPEKSFYAWHTDRVRKCCLNYELNNESTTYFGKRTDKDLPGRDIYDDLVRLDYRGEYVLLNTTEHHCVANTGVDRLLFTLGFNHTSFDVVRDYIEKPL
jgi:hypothetical protein